MSRRPAVFLDRDGVLNELVCNDLHVAESPLELEDVCLIEGAALAVCDLAQAGYVLVCVTNQPAAAKGEVSVERILRVHRRVIELLAGDGAVLDTSRMCMHHPEGLVAALAGPCPCRKPAPGMLLDAARALSLDLASSWMVGDTSTDVFAGQAAGCKTVLIEHPGSAHKRLPETRPDLTARNLVDGARQLLCG